MKTKKFLSKTLAWFPSLIITLFFVPNAFDKIIHANQTGKIIASAPLMIGAGVFLLLAVALFLYNKTALIGTAFLSLYMTCIVIIHMYKGKPYEVAMLIVMATIVAMHVRKSNLTN